MAKKSKKRGKHILNMQRKPANEPQLTQSVESGSETKTYFVHGPQGIHAQKRDGEDWKWMIQDGLNSVRSVVDNNVAVLQSMSYDPYGNPIDINGPEQTMYGYTGEPTDPNELVYLRDRYYYPGTGTFISQDTLEGSMNNPMSLNRYAYVQGNPINRTDPSGHAPVSISHSLNNLMSSNPRLFAQMMNNGGLCNLFQQDPCAGINDPTLYLQCQFVHQTTPIPGTLTPLSYYVPCDIHTPLNVRQGPSVLTPIVNIISDPAGVEPSGFQFHSW